MMICGADKSIRNNNNRLPIEEARVSFNNNIIIIVLLF